VVVLRSIHQRQPAENHLDKEIKALLAPEPEFHTLACAAKIAQPYICN